jgi:two-component system CheB/CheR fusion protein
MATRHCRVLVVDDDADNLESIAMLLGVLGHEVATATDGLQALEATKTFRPDVVLLDIGLPNLDGYEVAERIRAQQNGAPIRLVAITGWSRDDEQLRAKRAGFDHHLTKPVDPKRLESLIASMCAE